ncbi:Dolichyl-diphosphooligosaccharide--protein glycosyltransferase like [Verticillium longisporum]|uniref:Dolichyl-diphosphooligosaccharide--protein glycosyltransferase subunit OST2 n=1 Tax=Verticillium longisporum TaxID=100787 RepID=A0A0G4N5E7_VERLO|nr:Dolichyl-diphosphooligosaccharide--protein glycosyltransferase like [Verticillium longisporum]KAG7110866.1 Dolichyl-diphosphooligosaccharide--protein glycosyltransferase like [Verticillium longisporum]KAG7153180.1 Dolichyl-diphosphooligosaccharide--protein glycosyltransferase like [Verticillium longisporum]CRK41692.1 hypothetical protein BN1708_008526 [Verticillium longisporum]
MAPKKAAQVPPAAAVAPAGPTVAAIPGTMTSQPKAASSKAASASGNADWTQAVNQLLDHYQKKTPQRTKLIDVFLAFLVVLGGVQFVYCVLGGGFPFNAFLSGFCATVGQFVLTVSLRMQTTEANKADFPSVSPERSFADFVIGSLILHFFVYNLIN